MFKFLLIWRYFIRKRVALIAVIAVTLLVMMVLIVLSVMSGLVEQACRRNHNWAGDIVLSRESLVGFPFYDEFIAELRQNNIVLDATPVINTFALVESVMPAQLIGVRLSEFCRVTGFAHVLTDRLNGNRDLSFMVPESRITRFGPELTSEQKYRGCIFGKYCSAPFDGVYAARNHPVRLTVFGLNSKGVLTGSEAGENQTFWRVGEHKSGLVDIDQAILVDFNELQKFSLMDGLTDGRPPRTSEIRVKLRPGIDLDTARMEISALWKHFGLEKHKDADSQMLASLLQDVTIQTWRQYRHDFIAPMEKEKSLMIVVFCMIGLVAVFIVFAIFYMIVTEKIKDIGIIKSLGGSRWALAQVFLGYGALVGIVGALMGTAIGWTIVVRSNDIEGWLNRHFGFRLWDPEIYAIDKIPDTVDVTQAAVIVAIAIMAAVFGAAVPAHRAGQLVVVEALRVE
ncbi:MAG: FtsX-like permease family protein [Sedimentisphaerales bacterium]|nr:FtsX-like permease family protein [Sedimentisphaerales bacterium]